jgi:hypothetical protein
MRKVIVIAIAVLLVLGGGVWFLGREPAGSDAYSVLADEDEAGTRKCGLVFLDTLARDAAGNDLYIKVTASTELLEGTYPVALFGVEGLRVTAPESRSGESLRIVDAGLVAGELDTRQRMRRPEGDVDAFFATSTKIDDMLTLALDMLEGADLTLRLADESDDRAFALPRVAATPANRLIACFKGMQERINAAVAAAKKSE